MKIVKKCLICGNEFLIKPYRDKTAKYCSKSCLGKSLKGHKSWNKGKKYTLEKIRKGKLVKCPICGKKVYRHPSQIKKGYLYCSKKCWYKVLPERQRNSPERIEILKRIRKRRDFKSEKYLKMRSELTKKLYKTGKLKPRYGKDNNFWKGGIASKQNSERNKAKYKNWRKKVFERDGYICRICECKGGNLHAHHIKPFAKYPKSRYLIKNGLTVCRDCHSKIHGRFIP